MLRLRLMFTLLRRLRTPVTETFGTAADTLLVQKVWNYVVVWSGRKWTFYRRKNHREKVSVLMFSYYCWTQTQNTAAFCLWWNLKCSEHSCFNSFYLPVYCIFLIFCNCWSADSDSCLPLWSFLQLSNRSFASLRWHTRAQCMWIWMYS